MPPSIRRNGPCFCRKCRKPSIVRRIRVEPNRDVSLRLGYAREVCPGICVILMSLMNSFFSIVRVLTCFFYPLNKIIHHGSCISTIFFLVDLACAANRLSLLSSTAKTGERMKLRRRITDLTQLEYHRNDVYCETHNYPVARWRTARAVSTDAILKSATGLNAVIAPFDVGAGTLPGKRFRSDH